MKTPLSASPRTTKAGLKEDLRQIIPASQRSSRRLQATPRPHATWASGPPSGPRAGLVRHPKAEAQTARSPMQRATRYIHPHRISAHGYRAADRPRPRMPQTAHMPVTVMRSSAYVFCRRIGPRPKRGALPPQFQSLPMDQGQHPARSEGPTQKSLEQARGGQGLTRADQGGDNAPVSAGEIYPDPYAVGT